MTQDALDANLQLRREWRNEKATAVLTAHPDGYHIEVTIHDPKIRGIRQSCVTTYPLELIEKIQEHRGPLWLVDSISRDVDDQYVASDIERSVFSYVPRSSFRGARILDFGSGGGASTMCIARLLPDTQIIGCDINPVMTEISRLRAAHYALDNVQFLTSPDSNSLPDVGKVDFVFLTAVYEHLLPSERRSVMPMLWKSLEPGGTMFLFLTPYRWWPIEEHTTGGLPLLNFLPQSVAHWYIRHCSNLDNRMDDWQTLLRKGIRGGSIGEVLSDLREYEVQLMAPQAIGGRDCLDLWYYYCPKKPAHKAFYTIARVLNSFTGYQTVRQLEIALRKP
jgi:2-polyprenyl-3-methyl-5-hydroxy-6-metoxy-1,4-benzoquinol methylase